MQVCSPNFEIAGGVSIASQESGVILPTTNQERKNHQIDWQPKSATNFLSLLKEVWRWWVFGPRNGL
jgi:hypothetical protein